MVFQSFKTTFDLNNYKKGLRTGLFLNLFE